MTDKVEIGRKKEERGLTWRYDDHSVQVSERRKKVVVKTKHKTGAEYQKLAESHTAYKKRVIKSGIYGDKRRVDLLGDGIEDIEELKAGFQAIVQMLEDYTMVGNSQEIIRLFSLILLGYTARMFLGTAQNPDLLCSRVPVVLVHAHRQDFTGGFEHLSKIVECLAVDTSLDGKLHHHTPAVLPNIYFNETIDECAFLQTKGDKKKTKFPAQYRDTSVLIHSRFFKLSDIRQFIHRNPWAAILVFDRQKIDLSFAAMHIDMNLLDLSKRNWESIGTIKQMVEIRTLMRIFAFWLSDVHHRENARERAKYWIRHGAEAVRKYNFACMHTHQKVVQGSEKRYLWIQAAALRSFVDFCFEVGIVDEETQENCWNRWCNTLIPGSRDIDIYKEAEEKRQEEEARIQNEEFKLYKELLQSFIESADDCMIESRKKLGKNFTDKDYYRGRPSVIVGPYSSKKKNISTFRSVILLKKDLQNFSKEKNPAFSEIIDIMWGGKYSQDDYPSYIYKNDNVCLRKNYAPSAVVLYAEELTFLDPDVHKKIMEIEI